MQVKGMEKNGFGSSECKEGTINAHTGFGYLVLSLCRRKYSNAHIKMNNDGKDKRLF